ncbi:MAG: hypothetical protein ACETWK_08590 [Candidatus Aminicenantaceae bacterium]
MAGYIGGGREERNSNITDKCYHLKKNHGDCGQEIIACAINKLITLFKAASFQVAFASIAVT